MGGLPLWLQIAGVIGGIVGTVLEVLNLWLRIRENQPPLAVVAELTEKEGRGFQEESRPSENPIQAKFAERPFHALR